MTDAPPFISNEDPAIDGAVMLASFDQSVACTRGYMQWQTIRAARAKASGA